MKKSLQFFFLLVVVAIVAAGSSLLIRHLAPSMRLANDEAAHTWIHQQLNITPEQETALEPIERRYDEQRTKLTQTIRQANADLGEVLMEDKSVSPRVNIAIEKIHAAQGELQRDAIQHIFEMKAALTPEQGEKLLKLTAEALKRETNDGH